MYNYDKHVYTRMYIVKLKNKDTRERRGERKEERRD